MEIKLNYCSSDCLLLIYSLNENISKEESNKEIHSNSKKYIKEKKIEEFVKSCYPYFQGIFLKNCYTVNIEKSKDIYNNSIIVNIKANDLISLEIQKKLKSCREKEKLVIEKDNQLKELYNNIKIDENLLEKKLWSLINNKGEYYEKIVEKIAELTLDYKHYINELNEIERYFSNYRKSDLICLYFKIFMLRIGHFMNYLHKKYIIFLNNEKSFNFVIEKLPKFISKIVEDIYDKLFPIVKITEIYLNHKEEYDKKFEFVKEISLIFPLLKFFDNREKELELIYDFNKSIFPKTEIEYEQLLRIRQQIPQRVVLNTSFQKFSENVKLSRALNVVIRRSLMIYKKYKTEYPTYIYSSFLYD